MLNSSNSSNLLHVELKQKISECQNFIECLVKISGSYWSDYTFEKNNKKENVVLKNSNRVKNIIKISPFELFKTVKVNIDINVALNILQNCSDVKSVSIVPEFIPTTIPNDPLFSQCWHLKTNSYGINAEEAWNDTDVNFGEGMVIATIEPATGEQCRYTHEDFGSTGNRDTDWNNIVLGIHPSLLSSNFNGIPDRPVSFGHNTQTASVIVSQINNNKGLCGVVPKAKVKLVYYEHVSIWDLVPNAIVRAVDENVDVISISLTGNKDDITIMNALTYAGNNGVMVVWAHGPNNNTDVNFNPAPQAISVGSIDNEGLSYYSYGGREVVSPGINIVRASAYYSNDSIKNPDININDAYGIGSGNSLATPITAGVIAIIMKKNPTWSLGDIRQALHAGCIPGNTIYYNSNPFWNKNYGWGCINAKNSLDITLDNMGVLGPMQFKCKTPTGFKKIFSWYDPYRQSNYLKTVIVRNTSIQSTDQVISTGKIVWEGTGIPDGLMYKSDEIWNENGTYYFSIFNVDKFGNYSKLYGNPDEFLSGNFRQDGYISFTKTIASGYNSKPVADFTEIISEPNADGSVSVKFINQDLGYKKTLEWDFGDGEKSTILNPTHVYTKTGIYTVKHSMINPLDTSIKIKENLVTCTMINQPVPKPIAKWDLNESIKYYVGDILNLKNLSENFISTSWTINGIDFSTNNTILYTFIEPGNFTISLTVKNSINDYDLISKTFSILPSTYYMTQIIAKKNTDIYNSANYSELLVNLTQLQEMISYWKTLLL